LLVCLAATGFPAGVSPADSIVAVVGATPVLASEVRQGMDFFRVASMDTLTPDSVLRRQVLEQLVDNLVLQEKAREDTIEVTREEVNLAVEENIQQMRERFEDEDAFRAALAAEGLTERDLRERYEDDVRRKLLSQRLMEKEGLTRAYISPAEAQRFYEANRDSIALVPGRATLAHILLPVTPSEAAEAEGQRRAAEVLDILGRGGDFAVVAGSFSDDSETARNGGSWGWRDISELPLDIALVADQLQPGQVSPPFRSLEGYVILKLDSRSGDRVRVRTILLEVPLYRSDTTRVRSLASRIREQALAGAAFDSLAREFSQDPVTADSGGLLGEFFLDGLTAPFDSVVAALDSGDISEPVLSEHGFHLVKLFDKQEERVMDYLEMQDVIRNYLHQQKTAEKLELYLERISETVFVKRFD